MRNKHSNSSEKGTPTVSKTKLFAKFVLLGNICYTIQSEKDSFCFPYMSVSALSIFNTTEFKLYHSLVRWIPF